MQMSVCRTLKRIFPNAQDQNYVQLLREHAPNTNSINISQIFLFMQNIVIYKSK